MIYEQLVDFVQNRMRMFHVYQPVMLMTLLRGGGRSSTGEIARFILAHDEYYEDVTKNKGGRVLGRHGIIYKEDGGYSLVDQSGTSTSSRSSTWPSCATLSSTNTRPGGAGESGSTGGYRRTADPRVQDAGQGAGGSS